VTLWRRLLFAVAVLIPGTADAQDAAAPPKERERISIVAISAGRLGLLIPLGDRWMLRPDFAVSAYRTGEPESDASLYGGISLIRRSAPTDAGWTYGALRYGIRAWGAYDESPSITHALTVTAGAHGHVTDWLAVFGESGAAITYSPELNIGAGDVTVEGSVLARIGLALQMPRGPQTRSRAPEPILVIATEGERPSWIVGGFGAVGLLVPLTDRWALRPDFAFDAFTQRDFASSENADAGLSLLRRFGPTDAGWTYGAVRYGLGYDQRQWFPPTWIHYASVTLGGHARLRGRLGVMAEAGLTFRYAEQHVRGATNTLTRLYLVQRVGLTYRWKDRAP